MQSLWLYHLKAKDLNGDKPPLTDIMKRKGMFVYRPFDSFSGQTNLSFCTLSPLKEQSLYSF
jgi:hypothetical protein